MTTATQERKALSAGVSKIGRQHRFVNLAAADAGTVPGLDTDARTLSLSFSSEAPVERWFGEEILSHADGAPDFSRLNDGAPLLFNHDPGDVIGVVEKAWVDSGRGMATVRFAKTARADEILGMVSDSILRNVSLCYQVRKLTAEGEDEDLIDARYTATDWLAYEISLVSIPADPTVGVGRGESRDEKDVLVERRSTTPASAETVKGNTMTQASGAAAEAVDVNAVATRAQETERSRVGEIEALCKKHGMGDDFRTKCVKDGVAIELVRGLVLDQILARGEKQAPAAGLGADPNPDLTEKEKSGYSMLRAIQAAISGDWSKAGFERECSIEVGKLLGRELSGPMGFFMPKNLPFYHDPKGRMSGLLSARAQYQANVPAQGGALVATQLLAGSFIEVLRNKARVMQMGATMLSGLIGNVDVPRQSAAGSTFWVAEGANITEAEATFEKVGLTPRTLGAYSILTRNALIQTTPDIEMLARNDLVAIMALGIDLAALLGTGAAGQPLGIINTANIGSVVGGTNGANVSIDNLIDLETQVTAANAPEDSLAYLVNAKTLGSLKKLKSTTGQYLFTTMPWGLRSGTPGEINGYPITRSNQVPSNLTKGASGAVCSALFFGAWSELLIGEWGALEILANPYGAAYKSGGVEIRAMQTVDIAARHPASFAVMSDALTP